MSARIAIIACACLALVACNSRAPEAPADVLRRGLSAQPETLDPQQARSVAALKVLGDLYEGLLTRDAAGELAPGVAASWQVSDDQRSYTFMLRADAKWSDGTPVTAADFVHGWRHLLAPSTAAFYADLLGPLVNAHDVSVGARLPPSLGVQAIDERTLLVELEAPRADLLERLAHPALSPRHGDDSSVASNGAYMLADSNNAGRLTLRANPFFHAASSVAIPRVIYQAYDQELTEYNEFRSGGLDVTSRVPRQVFREDSPVTPGLRVAPYLGVAYLSFNMRRPPPLGVRQALAMSVDRRVLAAQVLGRGERPAWGLVPPGTDNAGTDYMPYDHPLAGMSDDERIAQARDLYARNSSPQDEPLRITLNYASGDENRIVAAALQGMWQNALPGIEVVLENREFRALLAMSRRGDFEGMVRGSWIADYNDAGQFLGILASASPANTSGFSDARYDALITAAQVTAEPTQRGTTMRAMEKSIAFNVPVIPLHFFVSKHLLHERVTGWQDNPLDLHYSRYLRLAAGRPEDLH